MRLVALAGVFALLAACTTASDPGRSQSGAVGSCIPNKTYPCLCGLDSGSQTCTHDGTYPVCDCRGADASAPPLTTTTPPTSDAGPTCGNGTVDPGEACDDGNTVSGDGCSAACAPDGTPDEALRCPGQSVVLWAGTTTTLSGSTVGLENRFTTSCATASGGDRMYAIEPSADGNMTVNATFAAGFDAVVEIRADVCDTGTSALCEDTFSAPFARVVPVLAHHRYLLVVDGFSSDDAGAYAIELALR